MSFALIIAGFDPSGGAGLLMDIKVLTLLKLKALAVPTSLTFQTFNRFENWHPLPVKDLDRMLKILFEDHKIRGIKIGMLGTLTLAEKVTFYLKKYRETLNWVVLDPVLKATLNKNLWEGTSYLQFLKENLFPYIDVLTPNLYEAEKLTEKRLKTPKDLKEALKDLKSLGIKYPLITGIKRKDRILTYFLRKDRHLSSFSVKSLPYEFHGTGCAFSSALLGYLLKTQNFEEALKKSLSWLYQKLKKREPLDKSFKLLPFL